MPNVVGTMFATWTDPDGVVWNLSDRSNNSKWFTTTGPSGWGAPQFELVTDPLARGGIHMRFVRAEPARIIWPLHIWGDTHLDFVGNYRSLANAFILTLHRQAPGLLRVARPDGSAREIEAFYEEGFGGESGQGWVAAAPVLTLMCPDGFWRDAADTVAPFVYGAGTSFFAPYPQVSSSQVLGSTTVNNPGDVTAWPAWTVTGPMVALTAINDTTGQAFELTYTLSAGQQITISTAEATVTGPAGENLIGSLNWPAAYLWPLVTGANTVQFNLSGAGAGAAVELSFRARYNGC
jgi:Phage tail protein